MTLRQARAAASATSAPMRAALYMAAAIFFFSLMGPLIRMAAENMHTLQVAFYRLFFAFLILLPLFARRGMALVRTPQLGMHVVRSLNGAVAMGCHFAAITMIPLSEAAALGFTSPLFATLAAVLLLGERIRLYRTAALLIGFLGVMLVLRPGFTTVSEGAMLAIVAAAAIGFAVVIVKQLTKTDDAPTITFMMAAMQTPIALIPALFVWTWPGPETYFWLVLVAATGTAGHYCWARAASLAEVTQLQPYEFAKLPMMALLGFALFGEAPSEWIWLGGAVIFGATFAITRREARLARAAGPHRPTPPS